MIILLSPAKTLDFQTASGFSLCTQPEFIDLSRDLIKGLSKLSAEEVGRLMKLSPKLAKLNHDRFRAWGRKDQTCVTKQAILAFKGDVYEGLQAWNFSEREFLKAQNSIRILSGLYGLLRPMDLIEPHRLEMGTVYANPAGRDLYAFWGDRLARALAKEMRQCETDTLINLASMEYAKAARLESTGGKIISPVFMDEKNGSFKVVSFYAKRARGLMANHLIRQETVTVDAIESFCLEGYKYSPEDSTASRPVFLRTESRRVAA